MLRLLGLLVRLELLQLLALLLLLVLLQQLKLLLLPGELLRLQYSQKYAPLLVLLKLQQKKEDQQKAWWLLGLPQLYRKPPAQHRLLKAAYPLLLMLLPLQRPGSTLPALLPLQPREMLLPLLQGMRRAPALLRKHGKPQLSAVQREHCLLQQAALLLQPVLQLLQGALWPLMSNGRP